MLSLFRLKYTFQEIRSSPHTRSPCQEYSRKGALGTVLKGLENKGAGLYCAYFRTNCIDESCDAFIVFRLDEGVRVCVGGGGASNKRVQLNEFLSEGGVFVSPTRCYLELEGQETDGCSGYVNVA